MWQVAIELLSCVAIIFIWFERVITHLCYKKAAPGFQVFIFAIQGYLRSQANLVVIWRELCKRHAKCMRKIMQCVWAWVMCKMRVSHTQCMKIESPGPWLHLILLCDLTSRLTSLALSLHSSFPPFHSVCCASWVYIASHFPINVLCFFLSL